MSKVNQYSPFWSLFRLSIEVEKNGELETIDISISDIITEYNKGRIKYSFGENKKGTLKGFCNHLQQGLDMWGVKN